MRIADELCFKLPICPDKTTLVLTRTNHLTETGMASLVLNATPSSIVWLTYDGIR